MTDDNRLRIEIPKEWWITHNMRLHWAQRAERTRWLRQVAKLKARHLAPLQEASIHAMIHSPTARGGDIDGPAPTIKALIDGIVDAGVLPDDSPKHLKFLTHSRGQPTGKPGIYAITLRVSDVNPPF